MSKTDVDTSTLTHTHQDLDILSHTHALHTYSTHSHTHISKEAFLFESLIQQVKSWVPWGLLSGPVLAPVTAPVP